MINIVRDWSGYCNCCGKKGENYTLFMLTPTEYSNVSASVLLCSKCRHELIKKLITLKED